MVRQSKRYTKRNTRRSRTRRSIKRGGGMFDFLSSKSDEQKAEEQRIEDSCKQQLDAVVKKYAQQSAMGSPAPAYGPTSPLFAPGQPNGQQRSMFAGRRRRSRKH
jgi:hypothetical protein